MWSRSFCFKIPQLLLIPVCQRISQYFNPYVYSWTLRGVTLTSTLMLQNHTFPEQFPSSDVFEHGLEASPSKTEENKHRNKLHHKGMAKKCNETKFRSNRLHRFLFSISGQQDGGSFAAKSRLTQFLSK